MEMAEMENFSEGVRRRRRMGGSLDTLRGKDRTITVGLHNDVGTRRVLQAGWTKDNMDENIRERDRKNWMEELERAIHCSGRQS